MDRMNTNLMQDSTTAAAIQAVQLDHMNDPIAQVKIFSLKE